MRGKKKNEAPGTNSMRSHTISLLISMFKLTKVFVLLLEKMNNKLPPFTGKFLMVLHDINRYILSKMT